VQNLYGDWATFAYYSTYFWAEFLLARNPELERVADGEWRPALAGGVAAALVRLGSVLGLITSPNVLLATSAVAGWCFVVAILGLGRRFLDFGNRALEYLSEAAFPVYILHQSAIVVPGYFLLRLPLGVLAKFFLVLAVAVSVTFAIYELVVRRFGDDAHDLRRAPSPRTDPSVVARRTNRRADAPPAARADRDARERIPDRMLVRRGRRGSGRHRTFRRRDLRPNGVAALSLRRERLRAHGPIKSGRERAHASDRRTEIVRGLKPLPDEPNAWGDGRIYDPTSGTTHRCTMRLDGPDRLRVRGYYGIQLLRRTTTWLRLSAEQRMCNAHTAGD